MLRLLNFAKLSALALVLGFYACKKTDLKNTVTPDSSSTTDAALDEFGRAGFGDFNRALTIYALTNDNSIDRYASAIPQRILGTVSITGLQAAETILAMDFRPSTGQLYGLGSSSRIYVINPMNGSARAIGAGPFTPLLVGDIAGFDFNPTVDRIRIITSSGQNLRANPETGTVAFTDLNINGPAGTILSGAAYTNNTAGVTATTLYDIDTTSNSLYIQTPPNDGTLTLVGALGLDVGNGGFDIANATDAFGIFTVNNRSNLMDIDLATGQANVIVTYPATKSYRGLAVATQAVAYAVDGGNNLLIFNPAIYYSAANLNTIVSKPITGLAVGESILGIDFRPLNGQLYALGSNSNVYTINTASGLATTAGTLTIPLSGTSFGFDFNPTVDRLRIVSNAGQNLRFNPNDGTVLMDLNINPATSAVSAVAYSNNMAGATTTSLFGIDAVTDQLVQVTSPNNGTVVPIGSLQVNADTTNGFDIGGTSGTAYALFKGTNNRTRVFSINTATGQATGRGIIGSAQIKGLAIGLGF